MHADCSGCGHPRHDFDAGLPDVYVYLLGLYLGDGCLAAHPRGVFRLSIYLDAGYPGIVEECRDAMQAVMPSNRVGVRCRLPAERMTEVSCYSKQWPCLLPQHGPGRKHERRIVLTPWQRRLVPRRPDLLVRGLLHSDGCRSANTIRASGRTYVYPRYIFSNRSDDIRRVFCDACDLLEVEWRKMNARSVSVARSASIARLDEFVGPKT